MKCLEQIYVVKKVCTVKDKSYNLEPMRQMALVGKASAAKSDL